MGVLISIQIPSFRPPHSTACFSGSTLFLKCIQVRPCRSSPFRWPWVSYAPEFHAPRGFYPLPPGGTFRWYPLFPRHKQCYSYRHTPGAPWNCHRSAFPYQGNKSGTAGQWGGGGLFSRKPPCECPTRLVADPHPHSLLHLSLPVPQHLGQPLPAGRLGHGHAG